LQETWILLDPHAKVGEKEKKILEERESEWGRESERRERERGRERESIYIRGARGVP
jgi:hypothetical protein